MTKKTKTKKEGNKIKKKPRLKNNSRVGFQKNSSKKNSSNNSKGKYCKTSDCFILSKNISTGVGLIVILTTVLVLGCLVLSYEMKNRDCISKIKNERKLLPNQVHRKKEGVKNGSEKLEKEESKLIIKDGPFENWKTCINEKDGYSISYPGEFEVKNSGSYINIVNYDTNDRRYFYGNPKGVNILIQKHKSNYALKDFNEYLMKRALNKELFIDNPKEIKLGKFIILSQLTKNGPSGSSMKYFAFNKEKESWYNLVVAKFNESNDLNRSLSEKILKTFTIL